MKFVCTHVEDYEEEEVEEDIEIFLKNLMIIVLNINIVPH